MGDVRVFGSGDYAMRLWLDPGKIAGAQHGRRRSPGGRARTERAGGGRSDRRPAVAAGHSIPIHRQCAGPAADRARVRRTSSSRTARTARPPTCAISRGSNWVPTTTRCAACSTAARRWRFRCSSCRARMRCSSRMRCARTMKELAKSFPEGVSYEIDYDPTVFVRSSIEAVVHTLFEAVLLVVLVVVVFLQTWRASVIPLVAVPVAIVGTLAASAARRLLDQFADPVRPGAGHRHRRRRCHRGGREHRTQNRRGSESARGGARRHGRGHAAHHLHHAGAVRGVRAGGIRQRPDRPVLSPVRHHHRGEHHHLDVQLPDPVAGAGGAAAQAEKRAARCVSARHQPGPRPIFPLVQSRIRARLGRLRSRRAAHHRRFA